MYDIEAFKKTYPGWISPPGLFDILGVLFFFSLFFLIPYIYITFLESNLAFFARNRVLPFVLYRLHIEKLVVLVRRVLDYKVVRFPKARV